ncbi:MAG: murein transglycosylase A [Alphaproteobacteria bacterium]
MRQARYIFPVFLVLLLGIGACAEWFARERAEPLRLTRLTFGELDGWAQTDPRAALEAFARSCRLRATRAGEQKLAGAGYAGTGADWRVACAGIPENPRDAGLARTFFEARFVPYRIAVGRNAEGLFTGYYEPLLRGSRRLHGRYRTALYAPPKDLVIADLGLFRENWAGQRITGRIQNGKFVPYLTRAEISRFGLAQAEPIVYVDDPVDAFFLHIQGSGRVVLDDGKVLRAAYAGQNGHTYTAIGKVLIERGALSRDQVSMQSIRAWLKSNPQAMQDVLDANASYVFFEETEIGDPALGPAGAEGVALTPEASLAVDRRYHPLGVPVWVETVAPDPAAGNRERQFNRLLVAQDTGGAIKGAVRGDVFWGFGDLAAEIAGQMKSHGSLTVLLPKEIASRLGEGATFR